ncbi:MAG: PEGA domain-containing protein, partial [Chitinispirillaceae bacterium]
KPEPKPASAAKTSPEAQSKPKSAPAAEASIYIASLPPQADVYINGRRVGKTNSGGIKVPEGTHKVKFVKGDIEKTETMTFKPGKNPTRFVKLK